MQRNRIRILFLGDIVSSIGRRVVKYYLKNYKKSKEIDFVIANGENATHGKGLSLSHYQELISSGVDCLTSGNHFFENRDCFFYSMDNYIRPLNFDKEAPLRGSKMFYVQESVPVRVSNVLGRVFLNGYQTSPFYDMDDILKDEEKCIHIVDFHAEATAEKRALGEYLDSRVTAVIGTHTHVQTNDAKLLNKGTFFITDVGMNGEYDSILGARKEDSMKKTINLMPRRIEANSSGDGLLGGVILDVDTLSFKVISFEVLNQVISEKDLSSY